MIPYTEEDAREAAVKAMHEEIMRQKRADLLKVVESMSLRERAHLAALLGL